MNENCSNKQQPISLQKKTLKKQKQPKKPNNNNKQNFVETWA